MPHWPFSSKDDLKNFLEKHPFLEGEDLLWWEQVDHKTPHSAGLGCNILQVRIQPLFRNDIKFTW